jgi:hypothetical protein
MWQAIPWLNLETAMTNKRTFLPPPQELIDRWVKESDSRPTMQTAWSYVVYKSSEWGYNQAFEPHPDSIKAKALRALSKIEALDIVSVWIGKDAVQQIKNALESLPNH